MNVQKNKTLVLLTMLLALPLCFTTTTRSNVEAQTQEIEYIDFPSNYLPLDIEYDNKSMVYMALYWSPAGLVEIDSITKAYNTYFIVDPHLDGQCHSLAIDDQGNVWVTEGARHEIAKFNHVTKGITYVPLTNHTYGAGETVVYHNGFMWTIYGAYLYRINTTTLDVTAFYLQMSDYEAVYHLIGDGDYIWYSLVSSIEIVRFNTLTNSIDLVVSGFDRPVGLAIKDNYIYVAECSEPKGDPYGGEQFSEFFYYEGQSTQNCQLLDWIEKGTVKVKWNNGTNWLNWSDFIVHYENRTVTLFNLPPETMYIRIIYKVIGTIAKVDKNTGEIVDRYETATIWQHPGGPYMVYFDSFNNLWWTDNSNHIGVFKSTGENLTYPSVGPFCYYMTQVKNKIWFTCQGSAYIGIVSITVTPVGGLWVPVDKFSLLAPYIALASTIILAVSISVAYIKYRKKQ